MSEESAFKVPRIDLKLLAKGRKTDLPSDANKVDIPVPSDSDQEKTQEIETENKEIPPIPYREPAWSGKANQNNVYSFEVLKSGVILEQVKNLQSKPFWIFGRLPNCDINMAHPTISRYHLILQYCPQIEHDSDSDEEEASLKTNPESGWYLYDLGSTHGTFLNKVRIKPRHYVRIKVGHMIKLGSSSRTFIFQGPTEDEEESSPFTISEIKERKQQQAQLKKEIQEIEKKEKVRQEKLREEEGISWGMGEDADEETDLAHNPYASTNNEELFLDDPKKTLRGFFEREGYDLDYKLEELSAGSYVCRVELPVDDAFGKPLVAESSHKGKKKECVIQCALEACRILDRQGLLRQANHEPRRKQVKHSDSDEDDFLDRTGDIEKKRLKKLSKTQTTSHNYEDLIKQESVLLESLETIENKIQRYQVLGKDEQIPTTEEDLDDFIEKLSKEKPIDKIEIRKLRIEQQQLQADHIKLQKLIKIAKPLDLPSIKAHPSDQSDVQKKKLLPLYGKRNKLSSIFGIKKAEATVTKPKAVEMETNNFVEEKEDEEEAPEEKESEVVTKKVLGPVFEPKLMIPEPPTTVESTEPEVESNKLDAETKRKSEGEDAATSSKKRRSRIRIREKNRENVDFDDAHELQDEAKNVQWVPPENQSGDGFTKLNEKYGY